MEVFSGWWPEGHVQGIAVDREKGFVYFSFTTILLKTDMQGRAVGSVKGLAGHLGCIDFDPKGRRVVGSLELKHDLIGKDIICRTGWDPSGEDNFYLVSFDADAITELDMDAHKLMKAVWLSDPVRDYKEIDPVSGELHVYGCSGIDGTAIGPVFGSTEEKVMIAYGIYSQLERTDNDHQVILQYDLSVIDKYGFPLDQENPHHSGPQTAERRYFAYTGNTRYGVQNLAYDPYSKLWYVCVYRGEKPCFGNYPMYFIDGTKPAQKVLLKGREEEGLLLTLAPVGQPDEQGVYGLEFPYGSTGCAPVGDGTVWFSKPQKNTENKTFASNMVLYRFENNNFTEV